MTRTIVLAATLLVGCTSAKTQPTDDAKVPAPAGEPAVHNDTAEPAAPEGSLVGLAALTNQAAQSILAAATKQPHAPRFDGDGPDLRDTQADVVAKAQALGAPKVVATLVELEARSPTGYLRSNCIVFPSGEVAWVGVEVREGDARDEPDLSKVAPELEQGVQQLLTWLRDGGEGIPMLQERQVDVFPEDMRKDLRADPKSVVGAAAALETYDGTWTGRVDDITVLVEGSQGHALLKTEWEVRNETQFVLGPVGFRNL